MELQPGRAAKADGLICNKLNSDAAISTPKYLAKIS